MEETSADGARSAAVHSSDYWLRRLRPMALKAAAEASAIDPTTGAEWQPVPEIVRLTLKSLHDVVKAQGETIKNLEKTIQTKVGKPEQTSALAEKVDLTELTQTFEDLSRVIDAKADGQETTAALEPPTAATEPPAIQQKQRPATWPAARPTKPPPRPSTRTRENT